MMILQCVSLGPRALQQCFAQFILRCFEMVPKIPGHGVSNMLGISNKNLGPGSVFQK